MRQQEPSASAAYSARMSDLMGTTRMLPSVAPQLPINVTFNGSRIEVSAMLSDADTVDQLIRALEATKPLLPQKRIVTTHGNDTEESTKEIDL